MSTKIPPKYIRVAGKLYRRAAPIKKVAQDLSALNMMVKEDMTEFGQAARKGDMERAKALLVDLIGKLTAVGGEIDSGTFKP